MSYAMAPMEKNINWKGDRASYAAKHIWARNNFGKPQKCEECGSTRKERAIHWANISGEHKRDRADWREMCIPCHRKYDYSRGTYHLNGSKHPWAILTEDKIKEIRSKYIPYKYPCKKLAEEYGVTKEAIHRIVTRKNWKHIK